MRFCVLLAFVVAAVVATPADDDTAADLNEEGREIGLDDRCYCNVDSGCPCSMSNGCVCLRGDDEGEEKIYKMKSCLCENEEDAGKECECMVGIDSDGNETEERFFSDPGETRWFSTIWRVARMGYRAYKLYRRYRRRRG